MNDINKIQKAIKFATKTHEVYQKQKRRSGNIPYVIHPLTAGIILATVDANDDLICAGILHDTIEDSIEDKKVTVEMLEERFGKNVAQMVLDVTETDKSLPWEERKKQAREHIKSFSNDSIMLKSADIISNMFDLFDNYKNEGESVFSKFHAPKEKLIENYLMTITILIDKWPESPLAPELNSLTAKLEAIK